MYSSFDVFLGAFAKIIFEMIWLLLIIEIFL